MYQTLSDFDIRFYMYEILKVRNIFCNAQLLTLLQSESVVFGVYLAERYQVQNLF